MKKETMRTLYLEPVTQDLLEEKASRELGEHVLQCQRISSSYNKHQYSVETGSDIEYLERAGKIIGKVGDFVRNYLPGLLSRQRANFDYIRNHQLEFLERHEALEFTTNGSI